MIAYIPTTNILPANLLRSHPSRAPRSRFLSETGDADKNYPPPSEGRAASPGAPPPSRPSRLSLMTIPPPPPPCRRHASLLPHSRSLGAFPPLPSTPSIASSLPPPWAPPENTNRGKKSNTHKNHYHIPRHFLLAGRLSARRPNTAPQQGISPSPPTSPISSLRGEAPRRTPTNQGIEATNPQPPANPAITRPGGDLAAHRLGPARAAPTSHENFAPPIEGGPSAPIRDPIPSAPLYSARIHHGASPGACAPFIPASPPRAGRPRPPAPAETGLNCGCASSPFGARPIHSPTPHRRGPVAAILEAAKRMALSRVLAGGGGK